MAKSPNKITARERDIIELIDQEDLTNQEIADRLFLAKSTVSWYLRHLNQKLYTNSRYEIVEEARRLGILADNAQFAPSLGLPRQATPFIGRDDDLELIHSILDRPDVRLLTVLAPGGMGKTRLALEAAEQQIDHFPDGIYFVPLRPVNDIDHIIPHIATYTGYTMNNDGRSPKRQVLDYLADKQVLIVMDNFEHLLDAAILLTDILQDAPDVKLIVTSREKLNLTGETVYPLNAMNYPTWETPDDALDYDAVQLLVNAASRVKPEWTVTADNLGAVVHACNLTAGMPLGILLAASWLDVFSLETICDEIQKSADILETEMRDVPLRQRSIRAVFQSTWERLKPAEQQVFMEMSVFSGGMTPNAAQAVTGATRRQLMALVNKSLLWRDSETGRYDIHELLRQYAHEKLITSGRSEDISRRYSEYYANVLYECQDDIKGHRQFEVLDRIATDIDNIRSAWQIAIDQENFAALENAMEGLLWYGIYHGPPLEGAALFQTAYAAFKDRTISEPFSSIAERLQTRLLFCQYHHYGSLNDFKGARAIIEHSLQVAELSGDKHEIAFCNLVLGFQYRGTKSHDSAIEILEKSFENFNHLGNQFYMALARRGMGVMAYGLGDVETSIAYGEQAVAIQKKIGDVVGLGSTLRNLTGLLVSVGEAERAMHYIRESRVHAQKTQSHRGIQMPGAILAFLTGDFLTSKTISSTVSDDSGYLQKSLVHVVKSLVACVEGDYTGAAQHAEVGLRFAPAGGAKNMSDWVAALAQSMLGNIPAAVRANVAALTFAQSTYLPARMAWCLPAAALIERHEGNFERATELLSVAFNHPTSITGWLENWPVITQFRQDLADEIGSQVFNTLWEKGKTLDLEDVVEQWLQDNGKPPPD